MLLAFLLTVTCLASCGGTVKSTDITSNNPSNSNPPPSNPPPIISGFTTFVPDSTSTVVYVSSSTGDDNNDGLSESKPVKTIAKGFGKIRPGQYDFLLFKRGDVWKDQAMPIPYSGKDATHPFVISYYGLDAAARPRMEVAGSFIDINGHTLNNFALIGLDIFNYAKDPARSGFSITPGTGFAAALRFVGNGDSILLEDNRVTYSEMDVESYTESTAGPQQWTNVAIRFNTVTYAYQVPLDCAGHVADFRPSGLYASEVNGFLIEGNIFDHNGFNEAVPGACATIYNHNFYLHSNYNLVMKGNLITRASSIGIKVSSSPKGTGTLPLDTYNNTFDNNFLYDNEIGMSMEGNDYGPNRFIKMTISNNVISETGLSAHTGRGVAWGFELLDFKDASISNNYFLHQAGSNQTNSLGLSVHLSPSFQNVTIDSNIFYALKGFALNLRQPYTSGQPDPWLGNISKNNLLLASPGTADCLLDYSVNAQGSMTGITYANTYSDFDHFCEQTVHRDAAVGLNATKESASKFTGTLKEPSRTLETYAQTLGYSDVATFLKASQEMDRYHWKPELTATAINAYIKEGFTVQ